MTNIAREMLWIALVSGVVVAAVAGSGHAQTLEDGLAALRDGYDAMALDDLERAARVLRAYATGADRDGAIHHHLARALEGIAICHANQGDDSEATRQFEAAVAVARIAIERLPNTADYHATLGSLYGQLAARSGTIDKIRYGRAANTSFARALALDPRNARAHVGAGVGRLETPAMFGGSVAEAIREFRAAQSFDPTYEEAWVWEGIALRRQGDIAEARAAFEKALAINPRSDHAHRELTRLREDYQ